MLKTSLLLPVVLTGTVLAMPAIAGPGAGWYRCIARAASHTGRYTFRIDTEACVVYWLEIDTDMTLLHCQDGIIKALKPSAISNHDIVYFDMNTGYFHDYLSGVLDRGTCTPTDPPQ